LFVCFFFFLIENQQFAFAALITRANTHIHMKNQPRTQLYKIMN
jgi:hypothetical protein